MYTFQIEFTPTRETLSNNGEERFLTEQPSKIISAGRFSHVPFITGSVTYEAGLLKCKLAIIMIM
jgi:hypothetical protein